MADQKKPLRTPSGEPSAEARQQYGYKDTGAYPIFDRQSAEDALNLRGHADSQQQVNWIERQAAKFSPQAARKAKVADAKRTGST